MAAAVIGCSPSPPKDTETLRPVGLQAIKERGVLRMLTRNNGNSYFVLRGRPLGFDYELGKRFADYLGVKFEPVVPPDWKDLAPMLLSGEGDIIGAGVTVTDDRWAKIAFADPYGVTQIRVAWGPASDPIELAEDLGGKSVHVRKSSIYNIYLTELNQQLAATGRPTVNIVFESEALETEQLLIDTAQGRLPYTLCRHHQCMEIKAFEPSLTVGPPVSGTYFIAWAVPKDAPDLLREVNRFLAKQREGDLDQLYRRYHSGPKRQAKKHTDEHFVTATGTLSDYDELMRKAAQAHNLDWRLLAAIAFEESRFDAKARTDTGGRGLFGMLPGTAQALKMGELDDPAASARMAAAYLSTLEREFAQVRDVETRLRFAVASYQAGHEHIQDARLLASQKNLNPSLWADVAKVLPLLALREYASAAKHGYVRGATTVRYVDAVWDRFRAYRHALGDRDLRASPR